MLSNNITEKLVGFQGVIIKNVESDDKNMKIYLELKRTKQQCPCCGTATRTIHDYRKQKIKDIPAFGKHVVVILSKRRYRCACGKRFFEKNTFLPRYHRMTNRLSAYVIDRLSDVRSFSSVAREVNLSVSTVIRIFDLVGYTPVSLPQVLSIDEFKGNTGREKYQCIITDPVNKRIIDILPTRYKHHLFSYFKQFERSHITHFISDMWETYADLSRTYFKNATYIIDKYHYIRQVVWAFEAARKEAQAKFNKQHRIYFKRSKRILTKHFDFLSDEEKQQVMVMLEADVQLSDAYFLKEQFFKILRCSTKEDAQKMLKNWITAAQDSGIKRFVICANTMINWSAGILNSFESPYTNGFTEGCNNKIKILKRNAYGYRSFSRFRNRILHIFNNKISEVA
jgi:transposase